MEILHGDEAMLDSTESFTTYDAPRSGGDVSFSTSSSHIPLLQSKGVIGNLTQTGTRSPSSGSRDESIGSSSKRQACHKSEEPSELIRQIHSTLSIDSQPNGTTASKPASNADTDVDKPKRHQLQVAMLPTGLCYDVRMRFHCELQPHQRADDHHPEDPRRIFHIYQALSHAGLVDDPMSTRPLVPQPLARVMARNATAAEICLVHDARHYAFMDSLRRTLTLPSA